MSSETLSRLLVVPALAMLGWAAVGILRGEISGKYSVYSRSEQPKMFWMEVGVKAGIGLVLLAAYFQFGPVSRLEFRRFHPTPSKANLGEEACLGKEGCIVVYVAPWCPICESLIGCLRELNAARPESRQIRLSVFVGWDKRARLEEMAQRIGPNTFVDFAGAYKKALRIYRVPTWFAFGASGKVRGRFSGAPEPCDAEAIESLLAKR